ncbi:MAG: hypothetical protein AB1603_01460 [Chloroflexota bacterium]
MRRGCMSAGDTLCDNCGRMVKHPDQYLALDESDLLTGDGMVEELQKERPERFADLKAKHGPLHLCFECALKKGYARYRVDKGEKSVTFFEK